MDIPNLAQNDNLVKKVSYSKKTTIIIIVIVTVFAITSGFWISRFWPSQTAVSLSDLESNTVGSSAVDAESLKVGVIYGNIEKTFQDTATGVIEKGNINGEGTHILNRDGGVSQRASLISSTIDLDLFVGKKVELKGETNASTKTAWLIDVGNIKILE
ncbi:MAG: hypothetical protein PHX34_04155 [Candidatus Shapirobacteria bacterium]|nr:hypothetical protein [Candidatus Shapirobacteria bacterium]